MPRRKNDSFFDNLFAIFMKVPPWVCIPVAMVLYVLVNSLILAFAGTNPILKGFAAGFVPLAGQLAAGLALLAGGTAAIARMKRRSLYEAQTSIESIRALSWSRFEQLIGEAYRREGYSVEENLEGGADGGVDLRLSKEGRTTLVQCKQWKAYKVAVTTVRELYGVMTAEKASYGILVTSGVFTGEAKEWAQGKPIQLIDGDALCRLIGHIQPTGSPAQIAASSTPTTVACPKCGKAMVLRTAKKGANAGSQFWGCLGYPSCKGTRDICSPG